MASMLVLFSVVFLAALAGYLAAGFHLRIPWGAAVQTVLVSLPLAHAVSSGCQALGRIVRRPRLLSSVALVLGVLALVASRQVPGLLAFAVVLGASLLLVRLLTDARFSSAMASAGACVVLLLGSVLYINYLVLAAAAGRLQDPALMEMELQLLGQESRTALYPLVRDTRAVELLEASYVTLAVQPLLVIMVLWRCVRHLQRFLLALLACYGVGALVFLAYPVVGPTLYFPDTLDSTMSGPLTKQMVESMRVDFLAITRSGQPITGFGYFIALPSLHAGIAVLCQLSVARSPAHFWFLLPVNALLLLSTVILGQHYLVDTVAGAVLGAAAWHLALGPQARDGAGTPEPVTR